jgi:hypothetical protein
LGHPRPLGLPVAQGAVARELWPLVTASRRAPGQGGDVLVYTGFALTRLALGVAYGLGVLSAGDGDDAVASSTRFAFVVFWSVVLL